KMSTTKNPSTDPEAARNAAASDHRHHLISIPDVKTSAAATEGDNNDQHEQGRHHQIKPTEGGSTVPDKSSAEQYIQAISNIDAQENRREGNVVASSGIESASKH
ncbi:unnamed protein product, partial [Didymodactylos carnosus]